MTTKPQATSTALATVDNMRGLLQKAQGQLAEVAPSHLKPERLTKLMLAAIGRNPKLADCTAVSVLQFCMKCSETGLEPIGAGGAWAVPYGKELTFIPDYRGLVNAAIHAGCIKDARAFLIHEADEFDMVLGLNPNLIHVPAKGDRGDEVGAYCVYTMPDGEKRFEYMSADEIIAIQKRSKAGGGPWASDKGEMWKKTVVRRAMKPFAGASQHFDAAIDADNAATGIDFDAQRAPIPMPKPKAKPEPKQAEDVEVSEPDQERSDELDMFINAETESR